MRFEIEAAARRRVVELAAARGGYRAVVDGRPWTVDAARAGGRWSLLVSPAKAGHYDADVEAGHPRRSYEIVIVEPAPGQLVVHVNGRTIPVTLAGPAAGRWRRKARRRRDEEPADARSGSNRVVAPMPGRVVKLLVKPGDAVEARQGLVVVEAMKMENELRAPRAGVVTEVRVAEGASVEANTVLVVIE